MDTIKQKAEQFTLSYKRAMELSLSPDTSRKACATALAAHYSPAFHSFSLGMSTALKADEHAAIVEQHLGHFEKAGFGWRMRLLEYSEFTAPYEKTLTQDRTFVWPEIHPYSGTSAQCWLTWTLEPAASSGLDPWQWTNIYGYRCGVQGDGKEGDKEEGFWEYAVSDHEIANLLERCPTFFEP